MILSGVNLSKTFVGDSLFSGVSFLLEEREKAALIGINGAGKTTLLKMIVGELAPDSGEIIFQKDAVYGYLAQYQEREADCTVYEEVLRAKESVLRMERELRTLEARMNSADEDGLGTLMDKYSRLSQEFDRVNGYAWQSEVKGILTGLGFAEEDYDRSFNTLSGGQKTRVTLGRLLLEKPDLLILDEPTNHLDIDSVRWLENYLRGYPGAVLVVSHDRYFLDRLVTKVFELESGKMTTYSGNYSAYAEKKRMLRDAAMAAFYNQQREIKHQEDVIARLKSFNREKSIKRAESREKLLGKIERLEKPEELNDSMFFKLEPNITSGNDVLMLEGISKAYGGKTLFKDVSMLIRRGEHVAVIGANGTGKTTLMKIINGIVPPDSGSIRLGSKVSVGYYDQEQQRLNESYSVFDEIREAYPDLNNTKIRNTLAAFLFTGEDVFKLVSELSGGERGRLSLAKLILSPCNFLILDEPTNHLDMVSKEILENAISNYTGTVLTVSHDRYFINRTATRILELEDERFIEYQGNYDYYMEKKSQLAGGTVSSEAMKKPAGQAGAKLAWKTAGGGKPDVPASMASAAGWKLQKEEQARERKRQSEIRKTEDRISALEERNAQIDALLAQEEVFTVVSRCMELSRERESAQQEIDRLFEQLERLEG